MHHLRAPSLAVEATPSNGLAAPQLLTYCVNGKRRCGLTRPVKKRCATGAFDDLPLPGSARCYSRVCAVHVSRLSAVVGAPEGLAAEPASRGSARRVAEYYHRLAGLQRGSRHPEHAGEPAAARLSRGPAADPGAIRRLDRSHRGDGKRVREARSSTPAHAAPPRQDGSGKRGAGAASGRDHREYRRLRVGGAWSAETVDRELCRSHRGRRVGSRRERRAPSGTRQPRRLVVHRLRNVGARSGDPGLGDRRGGRVLPCRAGAHPEARLAGGTEPRLRRRAAGAGARFADGLSPRGRLPHPPCAVAAAGVPPQGPHHHSRWHTLYFKRRLLNPFRYGAFSWILVSHKICRWLIPHLSLPALAALACLGRGAAWGRWGLGLAAFASLCAALAWRWPEGRRLPKVLAVPAYIVIGNLAALHAFVQAVRGERVPLWEPTRREAVRPAPG